MKNKVDKQKDFEAGDEDIGRLFERFFDGFEIFLLVDFILHGC